MRKIVTIISILILVLLTSILSSCHFLDDDKQENQTSPPGDSSNSSNSSTNTTESGSGNGSGSEPVIVETPNPSPMPTVEVPVAGTVTVPFKFHYANKNFDLYKGVWFEPIKIVIDSGELNQVAKFVFDKNSHFPSGIVLDSKSGIISGIAKMLIKDEKIVVNAIGKNDVVLANAEILLNVKELQATSISILDDHLCALMAEKDKDDVVSSILCWGDLSAIGDSIMEPHFICTTDQNYGLILTNANQICLQGDSEIKCKKYNEKDFRLITKFNDAETNGLALGSDHACLLEGPKTVRCWGSNLLGQLGQGPIAINNSAIPIDVMKSKANMDTISAGSNHTCTLDEEYKIYCWGDNRFGQLGSMGMKFGPVLVPNIKHESTLTVSSKENYSCALSFEDKITCWGEMYFSGSKKIFPPTEFKIPSKDTYSFVLGKEEACVHDSNNLYCWGKNIQGIEKRSFGKINASDIQMGNGFYCLNRGLGLNTISCWGRNDRGQLGVDLEIKNSAIPLFALPWNELE
ncbi:MAG: hypothetical protein HQK51_13705 [Oligoflexia bacterium]|nr:hypothetical protein [Oligoflexia bacterium]